MPAHRRPSTWLAVCVSLLSTGMLGFLLIAMLVPGNERLEYYDPSAVAMLGTLATAAARVKIEAIGNVFFDVSNASFPMVLLADLNGDGRVDCTDIGIVRASLGKRVGDVGFDPRADVNNDGIVDVRDMAFVTRRYTTGSRCVF